MARRRWVLAVATMLVTVAPWWPASAADTTTLLDRLNALRAERGLRPLHPAADLEAVAARHATAMADTNELAHNPSLAEQVGNWRILGENVGVGSTVDAIHDAFVASPRHLANLVESRYVDVGLGVVARDGRLWVVEVFRTPLAAAATVAAPATPATTAVPAPEPAPDAAPAPAPAPATAPAPAPVRAAPTPAPAPAPAPAPWPARAPVPAPTTTAPPAPVVVVAAVLWLAVAIEAMNGTRTAKPGAERRGSPFVVELPAS